MARLESRVFVMLGMGIFGEALETKLAQNGCRVVGVDQKRDRLEQVRNQIFEPVVGDSTDRDLLETLPISEAYAVVISLGENITRSLLATLHVKELGAKQVIVKGVTKEHGKILEHIGADQVIFPEEEVARQLADKVTWPNVLDYLPLGPDYSVAEVTTPDSLSGKTLAEANLRNRIGVHVMGLKSALADRWEMFPDGKTQLLEDHALLVVGRHNEIAALREMK